MKNGLTLLLYHEEDIHDTFGDDLSTQENVQEDRQPPLCVKKSVHCTEQDALQASQG